MHTEGEIPPVLGGCIVIVWFGYNVITAFDVFKSLMGETQDAILLSSPRPD
jgi:hypothetical protein